MVIENDCSLPDSVDDFPLEGTRGGILCHVTISCISLCAVCISSLIGKLQLKYSSHLEIVLDLRALEYDLKVGQVATLPARPLIWQENPHPETGVSSEQHNKIPTQIELKAPKLALTAPLCSTIKLSGQLLPSPAFWIQAGSQ